MWTRDRRIPAGEETPEDKTCPQWFATSPFVLSLLELVHDYREGRLGNVRKLPMRTMQALRIFSAEYDAWIEEWDARLS